MTVHPAEIQKSHSMIETLESRSLAKLYSPSLYFLRDSDNLRDIHHHCVISIRRVDVASIGSKKTLLHVPQVFLAIDEAEHNGFQARRAAIIFLVRVWRRCYYRIDARAWDPRECLSRIASKNGCVWRR